MRLRASLALTPPSLVRVLSAVISFLMTVRLDPAPRGRQFSPESVRIDWRRARTHQQCDFVPLIIYQTKRAIPEHAGALGMYPPRCAYRIPRSYARKQPTSRPN